MRRAVRVALGATFVTALTFSALPALASAAQAGPSAPSTERISTAADGTEANGPSEEASVSRDGSLAVFGSEASNLVPGDTNGAGDIFAKNLSSGAVERIGVEGRESSGPVLSANGRFIAFTAEADRDKRVYVHDLRTGKTERVKAEGVDHDVQGRSPAISADGRYVAFVGTPPPGDSEAWIYVTDRESGTTKAVEHVRPDWQPRSISNLTMNDDGTAVAYQYNHANGPRQDCCDVYFRDLNGGEPVQLDDGEPSDPNRPGHALRPVITGDGRFVTFESPHDGLVPGDDDDAVNMFRWNAGSRELERFPGRHGGESTSSLHGVPTSDGSSLLYTAYGSSPSYLMDLNTSAPARRVTPDEKSNYVETGPGAVSDGAGAVVYATPDKIGDDDTNDTWDVYLARMN